MHCNLITEKFQNDLLKILRWRNMIHLIGLTDYDRKYFEDADINFTFEITKELKDLISKDLS